MPKVEVEVSNEQLSKLCKQSNSPVKIAILQRGWVFVGRFSKKDSACKLENACCIRNWGTTKGIGEICCGPTNKTVLDKVQTVSFHELGIIALIDCEESSWIKHLS